MAKHPASILYVEDDPGSRKVMEIMTAQLAQPITLTIFEDSTDFIARVAALSPPPDVFLIDIHVLPLNGFEMLTALRTHPHFAQHMVVALTASVMNTEVQQLKDAGFDGVLAKPLNFHTFPQMLEQILRGKQVWSIWR